MTTILEYNNFKIGQLYQDRDCWIRLKNSSAFDSKREKECNRKLKEIEKNLQKTLVKQSKALYRLSKENIPR